MMRALFAGVSGLRNHQLMMDVIGNNIANVNTTGYKASRVTFKEAFTQLLQGATRPSGQTGGINPLQIGSGVELGSTDQLFTQGNLDATGQPLDLAIQGDSFFIVSNGLQNQYTRAGDFQLDANGNMIQGSSGYIVQGINADAAGNFVASSSITNIQLPIGQKAPAKATTQMTLTGNLDATAAVGATFPIGITVYDSSGTPHKIQATFTKTSPTTWDWAPTCDSAVITPAGTGTVTFNSNGSLASFTYPGGGAALTLTPPSGAAFTITIDPGTVNGINGLSGYANPSNAVVSRQDGYTAGDLTSLTVDANGVVTGFYNNGVQRNLAQIALARFTNPSGMTRSGNNSYVETPNSGLPAIGFAGGTNTSTITAGALEGSNVDIATEFTQLIVAQRGFQANAKIITTADEMLNDLVNLKR